MSKAQASYFQRQQDWQAPEGAHIYYGYESPQVYMNRLAGYVRKGIKQGQHVVVVEKACWMQQVLDFFEETLEPYELGRLHMFGQEDFYGGDSAFHCQRVLNRLDRLVQSFRESGADLRLWGHVAWENQYDLDMKLAHYECRCDLTLTGLGITTVCAYDGNRLSASIQNMLLKHHEYWMTDEQLVRSAWYTHLHKGPVSFPSIKLQAELESEVDLYKQKLDFIHVVSHEVRNPLTVIKAYAALLLGKEKDAEDRMKLRAIRDYVDVIDHEIAHIIHTEQMLSTEAIWRKKWIAPAQLLREVLETMEIKARTENITLYSELLVGGNETMLGNPMGFKLIVSNLVSNAVKYSEEGGLVTVKSEIVNSYLSVTIADRGMGMSMQQQQRLFLKYEKQNEEKEGQGIGLFMVKKLLDHFGGHIQVKSELGVGTTVSISFPMQVKDGCPT